MEAMTSILRRTVLVTLTMAAIGLGARDAIACTCVVGGPPCQEFFQADAVFVGTVRSIEVRKVPIDGLRVSVYDGQLVHFTIERAERGVQGIETDVWTGMGVGDCGYPFKPGQRYVVYAGRKDGGLGTGICSRTRPIGEASDDLAYFSSLAARVDGARVFGTVAYSERDQASNLSVRRPVADVQVLIRGSAGVFSGITDSEGRYAITRVPPGTYKTDVLSPLSFSARGFSSTFEIKDPRACRVEDVWLAFTGRVAGSVVDAAGRPLPDVRVEIAPAATPDVPVPYFILGATTRSNGQFEFVDVQPGSYVVGVGLTGGMDQTVEYPRTMFPGSIDVGKSDRVEMGTLRLPEPLRRYELKGVTVGADGIPIAGASVSLQGRRFSLATSSVRTGVDGSFTLPAFEGLAYTIRAYVNVSTNPSRQASAEQTITINGEPSPIRLVLVVR